MDSCTDPQSCAHSDSHTGWQPAETVLWAGQSSPAIFVQPELPFLMLVHRAHSAMSGETLPLQKVRDALPLTFRPVAGILQF